MELLFKYISVYLVSTVKFIGGPLAGITLGLSYPETVVLTAAGMMTTVLVFSYLGRQVSLLCTAYLRRRHYPVFSRRSRLVVRIWRRFGIQGVAFFTPLLLSPVFGTVVAAVFGVPQRQIFVHMLWSACMWSAILTFMVFRFQELALAYLS